MIRQAKAGIISHIQIRHNYYKLVLDAPEISANCYAGQFVHVRINDTCEPLLRRPLSIHNVKLNTLEILYEVVGKGTHLLTLKQPGDTLDIIGPLGNGFHLIGKEAAKYKQMNFIIAGGMGVAPLLFLAEQLKQADAVTEVFIGAKNKDHIIRDDAFVGLGFKVHIATEDGSRGYNGRVTDLFQKKVAAIKGKYCGVVYACGPLLMLKAVAGICEKHRFAAQVSLEEFMGCGIGACLGCAIKLRAPRSTLHADFIYKRVCKDGPVFDAREILW